MQTNIETTLARLVAIPSFSNNTAACREIIKYAKDELTRLGLHVTSSDNSTATPWFFATTRTTLKPDILLAAHLDVVPAPDELLTLRRRDGMLHGRGVYDMKFAAACYLEFLKAHANKLHQLNIGILFTTDEEMGGASMNEVLATGLRPKVVFIPDGGDNWHIEERAKGFFGIELNAKGRTAHGSRPWEGNNALQRIMDICQALRHRYPLGNQGGMTLSITGMEAGTTTNQIPDSASALLDVRSFDSRELSEFKEFISELTKTYDAEITFTQIGAPVIFDKSNPNIQSFLQTLEEVHQSPVRYHDSYGGSDARYFAPHNIPCIIIEPTGGGRHGENEWIMANELLDYYHLIEHWLLPEVAIQREVREEVSTTV